MALFEISNDGLHPISLATFGALGLLERGTFKEQCART